MEERLKPAVVRIDEWKEFAYEWEASGWAERLACQPDLKEICLKYFWYIQGNSSIKEICPQSFKVSMFFISTLLTLLLEEGKKPDESHDLTGSAIDSLNC